MNRTTVFNDELKKKDNEFSTLSHSRIETLVHIENSMRYTPKFLCGSILSWHIKSVQHKSSTFELK